VLSVILLPKSPAGFPYATDHRQCLELLKPTHETKHSCSPINDFNQLLLLWTGLPNIF